MKPLQPSWWRSWVRRLDPRDNQIRTLELQLGEAMERLRELRAELRALRVYANKIDEARLERDAAMQEGARQ